jgi:hypothetical protein
MHCLGARVHHCIKMRAGTCSILLLLLAAGVWAPPARASAHAAPVAAAAAFGLVASTPLVGAVGGLVAVPNQVEVVDGATQQPLSSETVKSSGPDGSEASTSPPTIFEPEDDWKEIMPGQHLPGVSRQCDCVALLYNCG